MLHIGQDISRFAEFYDLAKIQYRHIVRHMLNLVEIMRRSHLINRQNANLRKDYSRQHVQSLGFRDFFPVLLRQPFLRNRLKSRRRFLFSFDVIQLAVMDGINALLHK